VSNQILPTLIEEMRNPVVIFPHAVEKMSHSLRFMPTGKFCLKNIDNILVEKNIMHKIHRQAGFNIDNQFIINEII